MNSYNTALRKQTCGGLMKKIALMIFPFLMSVQAMAHNNALCELGEQFCYDYIDNVRPGSYHLEDCLDYVKKLNYNTINSPQLLMEYICNEAPNFYELRDYISSTECIDAARELGFFAST